MPSTTTSATTPTGPRVADAFAYLADVYVLPEHRGRGLGLQIVREAVEHGPQRELRWVLGTVDAHDLYAKLGFGTPSAVLMEHPPPGGSPWD